MSGCSPLYFAVLKSHRSWLASEEEKRRGEKKEVLGRKGCRFLEGHQLWERSPSRTKGQCTALRIPLSGRSTALSHPPLGRGLRAQCALGHGPPVTATVLAHVSLR